MKKFFWRFRYLPELLESLIGLVTVIIYEWGVSPLPYYSDQQPSRALQVDSACVDYALCSLISQIGASRVSSRAETQRLAGFQYLIMKALQACLDGLSTKMA